MISNQILQNTVEGLKDIVNIELCVLDGEGRVFASTDDGAFEDMPHISLFDTQAESMVIHGFQFFKVYESGMIECIVCVKGEGHDSYQTGKLAVFQIESLLVAYKEKYDRDNFIKNLLLDNLLLVDIYSRAKKLRIENDARRIVFLIQTDVDKEHNILEILRNIFPYKMKDFVTAVDENCFILVKELRDKDTAEDIDMFARTIADTLTAETLTKIFVSTGSAVRDLKDVSRSFKEAKMALEVGSVFDSDKHIINYEHLGIGRLIYQLPLPLCRMFLKEVLRGASVDEFDDETLTTVNKFFEYNLNVSETSRQLYIHRNTLVYRLDKLQKITGLDLRNFDDAIIFKITLMVSKYMHYMNSIN